MIGETEVRDWLAAYKDAWVSRDPDKVVALFTDAASYQERRFRPALGGIEAIRGYWTTIVQELQRDIAFDVEQVMVSGDEAMVHWRAHFTWRPIMGILELDAVARLTFGGESRNGLRLCRSFEEWIEVQEG